MSIVSPSRSPIVPVALLAAVAAAASPLAGQVGVEPASSSPTAAAETARSASPRVAVVGASVSAGFRLGRMAAFLGDLRGQAETFYGRELTDDEFARRTDSVEPASVLSAAYGGQLVGSHGDQWLFSAPAKKAEKLLTAAFAAAEAPALVIGVDLLTWFGYGTPRDAEPGTDAAREFRLGLQRQGLDLLDRFVREHPGTTFVVGDYPDLTGAVPLMITPSMIPTDEERTELNERLAAWANARDNVDVFPLAASLQRLRDGEVEIAVGDEERTIDVDAAFQLARVHPTRLGVALLVRDLTAWLVDHVDEELWPETTGDAALVAAAGAR